MTISDTKDILELLIKNGYGDVSADMAINQDNVVINIDTNIFFSTMEKELKK